MLLKKNCYKIWQVSLGALVLIFLNIAPVLASDLILASVPQAEKVGEARLRYMVWDVYDARLYAPQGAWSDEAPFALELNYLRKLKGLRIAERSIQEMRGQGGSDEAKLDQWFAEMKAIFPDVDKGVRITGVYNDASESVFYQGEREIGRIKDPAFGRAFFNIWLSEKTSEPDLRRQLLGQ